MDRTIEFQNGTGDVLPLTENSDATEERLATIRQNLQRYLDTPETSLETLINKLWVKCETARMNYECLQKFSTKRETGVINDLARVFGIDEAGAMEEAVALAAIRFNELKLDGKSKENELSRRFGIILERNLAMDRIRRIIAGEAKRGGVCEAAYEEIARIFSENDFDGFNGTDNQLTATATKEQHPAGSKAQEEGGASCA